MPGEACVLIADMRILYYAVKRMNLCDPHGKYVGGLSDAARFHNHSRDFRAFDVFVVSVQTRPQFIHRLIVRFSSLIPTPGF